MQKMEMVDFDSSSITSNIRVKRKTKRRNNKIASPSPCKVEMTSLSPHSSISDVSHIFMANISSSDKHKIKKSQTYFTEDGASTSNDISEIASLNQQALDLSYTTKSKTAKSYRDLIKERFQVIKQQVSNKSTNNERIKTFKSRAERIAMLNRNIEAMKKENLQIDNDLNKYNSLKQNFDDTIINYCEMYNFFCEEALNDVKNEEVEEVDSDNIDNSNKENNEKFVIVNLPAEKLDLNVEFAEKDMFWYPKLQMTKSMFVLCNNSLNNSQDNDDDGLYKVDLPKLPQSQMKIIKARLGADEIDWFRSDGELNILENPLNNKTYHPENYAEPKPILTEFNRAKKSEELNDDLTSVVVVTENILKIHISCLKFLHHPLFSIEHVLEQRLLFLYDQYREILVSNKIEHISKRLDTLRFRKKAAEDMINAQGDGHKDNIIKEIRKHTMEVKETRDELFFESKNFRNVIKEILDIWTAIKQLREENGYSNTNIRLIIRKEEQDYDKDHKKNRKHIELVSTEILEESWESNDDSLSEEASNISQEVKNKRFKDKNYIKDEVDRKFKECFRTPGEPIIHFSITYDDENNLHNNEKNEEISAKNLELKRQNAVNTTKIYLRFLCNNLEICKCNTSLNNNFTCLFGESFSVKLTNVPELLIIEVYEQTKKLLKRKICDIKLRLPKFAEQSSNNDLKEVMFSKEEIVHYTHEGVGSSINAKELIKLTKLKNMEFFDKLLVTTGILTYNLQWECKQQNDYNLNLNQNIINDVNKIDLQKLKDWTKHSGIDPENPKNAMLFQYIEEFNQGDAEEGEEQERKNLNMQNPNLNQFLQFCDKAKIEENIRFKFLELRDKNEREFVGMVVPNRIKEIPTNVLSAYKRRLHSEDNIYFESEYEDDVDRKRSKGGKYLQLIYTKIFQQCINTKNHLEYEDVVDEKMFTYVENIVKVLFYNFLNWFKIPPQMSQSLPKIGNVNDNKETFDLSSKLEALNRTIQIFICVETVINFPTRLVKKIKSETSSKLDGNEEDGDNEEKQSTAKNKAGCFVQISHKEEKMRTKSASRENPKWDETFTITLQAKNTNYLNPEALNGHITVDVFDEVDREEEDLDEEDCKSKKSWLGFVNIPMLAIFQHKKMEGLFQLNSPQVLFGFEQFLEKSQINSPRFSHPQNIINKNPYIQLKIHAESNIPKMHPNVSELASNEPAYLYKHITSWSENYAARFPTRKFSTLAIDLNCKTCCITRYITPLEPPLINRDGFEVSLEQCVRFVSLIPFNEHNSICASIWQTTNSLLKTMTGTIYDHAIALTNFFVALEVEVWLLLGFGVPYGSSAFVLVREYITENEEPSHFIFDVTTGLKYNVQDKHSPLHRVYCVVNQKNVWANVQRSDDPASIRFDFSKRGDWLPLFNNQISAPTISIQQKLIYNTAENVQNIEYKLEKKIQRRIMKLRKMHRTIWNHDLTNRFRMVMKKFEMSIANGKHNFEMLEMKKVLKTNKLNGFVISVPYTNAKAICKFIADTSIHQVEEDSEFILAVHLHSYPNHVIAIWIVFAIINK